VTFGTEPHGGPLPKQMACRRSRCDKRPRSPVVASDICKHREGAPPSQSGSFVPVPSRSDSPDESVVLQGNHREDDATCIRYPII